jgi:hypothetical protein
MDKAYAKKSLSAGSLSKRETEADPEWDAEVSQALLELAAVRLAEQDARAAANAMARVRRRKKAADAMSAAIQEVVPEALAMPVEVRADESGWPRVWLGQEVVRMHLGTAESVLEGRMIDMAASRCSVAQTGMNSLDEGDLSDLPSWAAINPKAWAAKTQELVRAWAQMELQTAAMSLSAKTVVMSGISRAELGEMFAQAWDRAQCQDVHEEEGSQEQ